MGEVNLLTTLIEEGRKAELIIEQAKRKAQQIIEDAKRKAREIVEKKTEINEDAVREEELKKIEREIEMLESELKASFDKIHNTLTKRKREIINALLEYVLPSGEEL
ncbi:MAG: hypothetical protein DRJ52_01945 [Thermoprotei archaeon]|nr:MAG: hypothetical protein DRJ52_01945 [Thermoprotei archaeon]RLE99920.1 MAG: hypothetical protein DRJ63_03980 [Thermoprotei archaeon]HDI74772.1 hypothetical protein [Thermoprotei archaeon]